MLSVTWNQPKVFGTKFWNTVRHGEETSRNGDFCMLEMLCVFEGAI